MLPRQAQLQLTVQFPVIKNGSQEKKDDSLHNLYSKLVRTSTSRSHGPPVFDTNCFLAELSHLR